MKILEVDITSRLREIHNALDDAMGDSDIEHMSDDELRDAHPVQWAATRLAKLINTLDHAGSILRK